MRILGIGETHDLAAMYYGMRQRGHEVKVFVEDAQCHGIMRGAVERSNDWKADLAWVGKGGIVVFESAVKGAWQDELRAGGYRVIGGSAFGDRLEADRTFGQALFADIGLPVAATHRCAQAADAIGLIRRRPARYVLKYNGANSERTRNYVGVAEDGSDVADLLRHQALAEDSRDLVLMEHLEGIEIGVGGYFDGQTFLRPACIDFEHKRFFPGDLGELTGEMGTVVSYRHSEALFEQVLAPLACALREGRYVGYINVNLIANERGLWPLEFTSRFGYPGFAICERLHREPWEALFERMLRREGGSFATLGGFAVGIVLTLPPFPYTFGYENLSKGLPVMLPSAATDEAPVHVALAEVERDETGVWIASGRCGYVGVALGAGRSIAAAREDALASARCVSVPNLRYRQDIGQRVESREWHRLQDWGYLRA